MSVNGYSIISMRTFSTIAHSPGLESLGTEIARRTAGAFGTRGRARAARVAAVLDLGAGSRCPDDGLWDVRKVSGAEFNVGPGSDDGS
ncbi:hypothetical protein GCM10009754_88040 [Amycolatopsis minnesotensis]|uniref:Uncharacterized protein n=1 Tax=Amycolatopsis minnesotensis TaxID=337894 RepID=A0ABN2SZ99_9PSEU